MTHTADYETTIAKIESTHLGYEDHGIFSLTVRFSYGGSGQGFGAICLGDVAHEIIPAVLKAAGVDCWERLVGRTVYAIREPGWSGLVRGMAPLPTESGEGFVLVDGHVAPYPHSDRNVHGDSTAQP